MDEQNMVDTYIEYREMLGNIRAAEGKALRADDTKGFIRLVALHLAVVSAYDGSDENLMQCIELLRGESDG